MAEDSRAGAPDDAATRKIRVTALIASVLSTVLSSVAWITEREAIMNLSPLAVSSFSMLMGAPILLAIAWLSGSLPAWRAVAAHRADLLQLLITRTFAGQLFLVYALTLTSSSKVMFLTKVEPYLIVFWFWLLRGERVQPRHLTLLAVHVAGAIALSTGGDLTFQADQLGDLLVLAGIAANALSYAPAQNLAKSIGSFFTSGFTALIGGVVLLPFALLLEPSPFLTTPEALHGWKHLIITVVIFYVLSTAFWYISLKGLTAWISSALRCIGPVIAAPIAWAFYDQPLTAVQIIGGAVVLITSVLMVRVRNA